MIEEKMKLNKFWITFLAMSSIIIGFLEFHGIINSFIQSMFQQQTINIQEESLFKTFNQQKQFHYKDLIFSSEIDSGNLQEVRKIDSNHFSLKIGTDPENSIEPKIFRNWFYFQVRGFYKEANFKFTINNLKYNWQMWKHGLVPVYRSKLQTDNKWKLLDKNPVKLFLKNKKMALEFEFNFKKNDVVEFALTFPYSYQKNIAFFKKAQKKFNQIKNVNFVKTLLIKSNLEKDINLFWLSYQDNQDKKNYQLPRLKNLFPTDDYKKIQYNPEKCIIIISARVHPSETASSYLLEGFVDYLTNNEQHTKKILKKCSIGIIPMLNPDGVQLGLTRTDSEGLDLNRHYDQADLQTPSIYALKKLMRFFDKKKLTFYFDFHSHFTKRGMFLFGNPLTKKNYKKILKYPVVLKNNLQAFDLNSSSFGSDKDEATSRRELYKYTKLNKLYTVEVNYWGGKQKDKILKDKKFRQNNLRMVKNFEDFYKLKDFRHMGYQLGKSLSDYFQLSKKNKRDEREQINKEIENFYMYFNKKKNKKKIRKQKKIGKTKKTSKKNSLFN